MVTRAAATALPANDKQVFSPTQCPAARAELRPPPLSPPANPWSGNLDIIDIDGSSRAGGGGRKFCHSAIVW